jgi:hypothetical protein
VESISACRIRDFCQAWRHGLSAGQGTMAPRHCMTTSAGFVTIAVTTAPEDLEPAG